MNNNVCAEFVAADPAHTHEIGRRLGRLVRAGDCLALSGPLGAGKTCLVGGVAEGMGVEGRVASPSFIIMRAHPGPVWLYHADAYRLADAEELVDAGLDEWLENGVVALEWAERADGVLPNGALLIEMAYSEDGRSIRITARDSRGRELIRLLCKTT